MGREITEKRREQNRNAQRLYRNNLKSRIEQLEQENAVLLEQARESGNRRSIRCPRVNATTETLGPGQAILSTQEAPQPASGVVDSGHIELCRLDVWSDQAPPYSLDEVDDLGGWEEYLEGGEDMSCTVSHVRCGCSNSPVISGEKPACEKAQSPRSCSTVPLSDPTTEHSRALHLAVAAGSKECVDLLVDHGWSINMQDPISGLTPLMIATTQNDSQLIQMLLKRGADTGIRGGSDDKSALELAAHLGHAAAVKALLDAERYNKESWMASES